ncbi:hypothetical protein B0H12DRAFT_1233752 [Mycena haematopus]|nr:hypothetical protein B0H12DRAFT_1233752 [Mycena haematopus]
MPEDLKAADEEQLLLLEEEFRELTMKEGEAVRQLYEIRTAKQRVRRLVAEKKNRYAPIFTLPNELLVSIVQAAQQSTDSDSSSALVEVVVSHVSQGFRWAVISAASLWSSIDLRWGVESDEERLAVYLARSRSCLLSVQLEYHIYHGEEEREYDEVRNELATVAQHISRIRRLVMHYEGEGLASRDTVMHFESLHAPCLEYLDICSHASDLGSAWGERLSIFSGGTPRLSTLKLNNVYPTTLNVANPSPWLSMLTHLDFRGQLIRRGLDPTLLASPQLIDLTLDSSTFFFVAPNPIPISMPSLRCLRALCLDLISYRRSHPALIGILTDINAPALEVLEFSGVHISGSKIASFLTRLPISKFPALKSLTFANSNVGQVCYDCTSEHIEVDTLRFFSTLESLTIVNICGMEELLLPGLLAVFTDADGIRHRALPSLRKLTLRYKDAHDFGIAGWPKLSSSSMYLDNRALEDPLEDLRTLLAPLRELYPLHLRLPRSRFFTERDWDPQDADFEIFDVEPLLRSLGYSDSHFLPSTEV